MNIVMFVHTCNLRFFLKIPIILISFLVSTSISHSQRAGEVSAEKPFVINLTVRGEYDDNINTSPDDIKDAVFSVNIRPSVSYEKSFGNTFVSAAYTFGFQQFFDREGDDDEDFSHTFEGRVNHRFNSRFSISARERFSFDQEDDLASDGIQRRVGGDRIRNNFSLSGSYDWTERFSTLTSYDNEFLNFFDGIAATVNNFVSNEISQQFRFQATGKTTPFLNYVFETTDFEDIARDRNEHRALVGVDQRVLDSLVVSAQVGAEFVFFDNSLFDDTIGPFAAVSTVWNYDEKSNLAGNYSFGTNNTDNGSFSSSIGHNIDGTITHFFTPKLSVGALGRYELAEFDSSQGFAGSTSDVTEHTFSLGINARYQFADYLSADVGYTYSETISDTDAREFDRNRVFIGISGAY